MTRYFCDAAYLGTAPATADVLVTVEGERFAAVDAGTARPADAVHLRGLTLPGFANAHSHAFHRALRGRAEGPGTFWTWREQMYALAAVLDPASYRRLATAVFAEMVLAGYTAVGEFHYLHHQPEGGRYEDPNEMGAAVLGAAGAAGIRITLLDVCYLGAGAGRPLSPAQRRFADAGVEAWAERVGALTAPQGARLGAAVHSLRAVPPPTAGTVAQHARALGMPLHFHLSEQPTENDAVLEAYGATPAALLEEVGALGAGSTAVHATHLTPADIEALGSSRTQVCVCPTTERSLGDGIGPARALADAGSALSLGSDSHAVVDPFEEARALELDERLASGARGRFGTGELLDAACAAGHRAIGWSEAGRIEPGCLGDLVTVSLDSVRLAGAQADDVLEHALFAAGAPDVTDVVVSGRHVVAEGRHVLGDVAHELRGALGDVLGRARR